MQSPSEQWSSNAGAEVFGSDGDTVGEVVAFHDSYIVVRKEYSFPTDYYIPTSAISNVDGDKVYLSVTRDHALAPAPFRDRTPGRDLRTGKKQRRAGAARFVP